MLFRSLLLMRWLSGIGLGTIVSNASSLVGEYSSKRLRARMIMYAGVGFTAGAAFGGFIAAELIPTYGWTSVFYFGGAVPILIAAIMSVEQIRSHIGADSLGYLSLEATVAATAISKLCQIALSQPPPVKTLP